MGEAPYKIVFAGFRHGHIFDLYALADASPALEVVAACEEHAETRAEIRAKGTATITHERIEQMLDEVDCDIVATGTYFAGRGTVLIEALARGKHVISDKPLCTSMADLDRIAELAREKNLKVGCMLTMRDSASFIGARNLIQAGRIGEVHAIAFGGQHPLGFWARGPAGILNRASTAAPSPILASTPSTLCRGSQAASGRKSTPPAAGGPLLLRIFTCRTPDR